MFFSMARRSSAQTPVALTTQRARTCSPSHPSPASTAPSAMPSVSLVSETTRAWLTMQAPWSTAAVRARASVSRASSVWAS